MLVNARMYSVCPAAREAWRTLIDWVMQRAGVQWDFFDWDAPKPLAELWARDDLGCAMMCGLPYSLREPRPQLIAAPIPSPARYAGRAVYFSDIAVRADANFRTLEDTFGGVCGYTLTDSMSGCVAFRRLLLAHRKRDLPQLYRSVVGNLVNARGIIQALADRRIDVGPLDGYVHDLLKHTDPKFAAQVRIIATTDAAPMPPFVATAPLGEGDLARLRQAFAASIAAPELKAERETLLLRDFAFPKPTDYDVFGGILHASEQYAEIW